MLAGHRKPLSMVIASSSVSLVVHHSVGRSPILALRLRDPCIWHSYKIAILLVSILCSATLCASFWATLTITIKEALILHGFAMRAWLPTSSLLSNLHICSLRSLFSLLQSWICASRAQILASSQEQGSFFGTTATARNFLQVVGANMLRDMGWIVDLAG